MALGDDRGFAHMVEPHGGEAEGES